MYVNTPRQVGEARNSNATQSTVARNLNLNFPGDGNFAQEYSPRRPQRESEAPERSDRRPPQNSILQGTEVPLINNKNLNFQKTKNSRLVDFATANDLTGPEESTQADLESAASFRDNVAEVKTRKVVQFKDGTEVIVPSEMNLDNSNVLEFLYNSALKSAPKEPPSTARREAPMGSDCLPSRPKNPCTAPKGPKNRHFAR